MAIAREEKKRLSSAVVEQDHRSLLGRLFGGSSSPTVAASEGKVEEMESRIRIIHDGVLEQQKHMTCIDHYSEPPWDEECAKLESLRVRLKELEDERLAKVQHAREREETTASIASTISGISTNDAKAKGHPSASG